jgi:Lon protease-like protein
MFPLGSVVMPGGVLPLHIFEPRYRELVRVCLDGDREFGVVLIERGSEVGGGDVRSSIGTAARIIEAEELPDGRWGLVAIGVRRLRVCEWFDDDPYPVADVEDWAEADADGDLADLAGRLDAVAVRLRRVLAAKAELDEPAAPATSVELTGDAVQDTYVLSVLAPFGPADSQRLLACAGPRERTALLEVLVAEEDQFLQQRLGSDG